MRHPLRVLAVLVLAAACGGKVSGGVGQGDAGSSSSSSSSGGGSGGSSGGDNSCLETSGSPQACISCIESQCGPQLSAVESGCSDLLDCECPGGVYNEAAAESCTTQGEEASCTSPATQINQCESQNCLSQCETISSSGGGGSSSSGSSGGPTPLGCTVDPSLGCSGGASGYACAIGDNPELADPDLSCSTPGLDDDGEVDFCCFSGGAWSGATCKPDDELTSSCPDPDTYGYQCAAGDDPTSYVLQLSCSAATPDADGVHDDFCCTYD